VEHLSFLGKMSSELPALEREFEIVNKLFTIARSYNVQVTDEELALYQTLGPDFITLKVHVVGWLCMCLTQQGMLKSRLKLLLCI